MSTLHFAVTLSVFVALAYLALVGLLGVVAALRAAGIVRMRIFRQGTRLFMYCEGPDGFDPARDYQQYALDPECRKWDELMRRFQRPVPGAPAGAWWAPMDLVFDLESCPGAHAGGAAG